MKTEYRLTGFKFPSTDVAIELSIDMEMKPFELEKTILDLYNESFIGRNPYQNPWSLIEFTRLISEKIKFKRLEIERAGQSILIINP